MSNNSQEITVVGNLTADVELRYTPAGNAVANFTVAKNTRYFDTGTNEWVDGETLFFRCNVWREQAENLAASGIKRGSRVIVTGNLQARSFETKEGEKRTVWELTVEEIGASVRFDVVHHGSAYDTEEEPEEVPEPTPIKKTVAKPSTVARRRK